MSQFNGKSAEERAKASAEAMKKSQDQQDSIAKKSAGTSPVKPGTGFSKEARRTDQAAGTEYQDGSGGFDERDKLETGE